MSEATVKYQIHASSEDINVTQTNTNMYETGLEKCAVELWICPSRAHFIFPACGSLGGLLHQMRSEMSGSLHWSTRV